MRAGRTRWSWCAGVLLLAGCAAWQAPTESPNVSLVDLKLLDMKLFEQRYGLTLRVQNPNPVPMAIEGMNYRVQLNDVEFGRGVSRQSLDVPAYGESLVDVEVVSNLFSLAQQLKDLQFGEGQGLRIGITGGLNLAQRSGELPFKFQGEIGGTGKGVQKN